jgi:hypothetical protein
MYIKNYNVFLNESILIKTTYADPISSELNFDYVNYPQRSNITGIKIDFALYDNEIYFGELSIVFVSNKFTKKTFCYIDFIQGDGMKIISKLKDIITDACNKLNSTTENKQYLLNNVYFGSVRSLRGDNFIKKLYSKGIVEKFLYEDTEFRFNENIKYEDLKEEYTIFDELYLYKFKLKN